MEMFTNGATSPDPVAYLQGWITDEIPTRRPRVAGERATCLAMSSAEYDELWAETCRTDPVADRSRLPAIIVTSSLQDIQVEITGPSSR